MCPNEDRRLNPDEILKSIEQAQKNYEQGHLRIFFGMCPGVGKTFSMLQAAQEKKKLGLDVVIGVVESHGRLETQQIMEGLEKIPLLHIAYRETFFEELDLDGVLKRKPKIVLIDELAHTNIPGSRHYKRYQDVQEVLKAGIDVYTTLNVQHIESRADLVYQITGVQVQETVPDSFLEQAQQMELVDVSPEELLRRLEQGKVYMGERAVEAAENFFKIENLIALRELALRFTAEKVDEQLRLQMMTKQIHGPWNTNERLLVAVGASAYSMRLIRAARRMAYNLEAPWIALYVETDQDLSEDDRRRLQKNLALAKELGAEVLSTRDSDIAQALQRIAHEKNVTQIVLGRPDRRFFKDLLARGTLIDQLMSETSEIDIHVIRQDRRRRSRGLQLKIPKLKTGFFPYWFTLWFMIGVSLLSYAFLPVVGYRALGFVFLFAVLVVGSIATVGPIFFAAFFAALVWNYFFIPPQFTLSIKEPEDAMNFFALFVVACVAGYLESRIKQQGDDLSQRAHRASVLYDFGRRLAEAKTLTTIAEEAAQSIQQVFRCEAIVLLKSNFGDFLEAPLNRTLSSLDSKEMAVAAWTLQNQKKAGWSTETLSSTQCLSIPLLGRASIIGVLIVRPDDKKDLSLDQTNLLDTFSSHLAVALERELFVSHTKNIELLAQSEKLHQALLSSVSHELRTPLTAILGAATALRKMNSSRINDEDNLIDEMISSSERLNRVVANLLDMTRISSGVLKVNSEIFELNDFAASVFNKSKNLLKNHQLVFLKSKGDVYVRGDEKLTEHILLNLITNAVAYSPLNTCIRVSIGQTKTHGEFSIQDEGRGIPSEYKEKIFERFFRVPGAPPGGTGLGLSIVKSLLEAQSGSIELNSHHPMGSEFICRLPLVNVKVAEQEGGAS